MALVYCPCPNLEEAKRLGNALLDARLAGCINILPGMVSLYDWKGAREEAAEVVLIAKTTRRARGRRQRIPRARTPLRRAGNPDAAADRHERRLSRLALAEHSRSDLRRRRSLAAPGAPFARRTQSKIFKTRHSTRIAAGFLGPAGARVASVRG